jgi:hypothetical protein
MNVRIDTIVDKAARLNRAQAMSGAVRIARNVDCPVYSLISEWRIGGGGEFRLGPSDVSSRDGTGEEILLRGLKMLPSRSAVC